jgi:hypothetical protein
MSDTKVGTLKALFSLDSTKFDRGMKNIQKSTKKTEAGLNKLKGVLVGAFSVVAVKSFIQSTLTAADSIGKFADRAGIATDRLQTMKFAFDLAGVGAEGVNKAMITFGKRLGKARQGIGALAGGLKGGQEELLNTLLRTKDMNQALDVMFTAMGNAKNQAEKLSIADAAFGMAGLRMTAAFRDGSAAFFEAEQRARDLGLVIDEKLIRNAEQLNDEMLVAVGVIGIQMKAAFLEIAPALTKIVGHFIEWNQQLKDFNKPSTLNGFAQIIKMAGAGGFSLFESLGGAADNETIRKWAKKQKEQLFKQLKTGQDKFTEKNPKKMKMGKRGGPVTPPPAIIEEAIEQGATPDSLKDIGGNFFGGAFGGNSIGEVDDFSGKEAQLKRILDTSKQYIRGLEMQNKIERLRLSGQKELADEMEREITLRKMAGDFTAQITDKDRERLRSAQTEQKRLNELMEKQNRIAEIGESVFDNFGDGVIRVMQEGGSAIDAMKDSAIAALFDIQREIFKLAFNPLKEMAVKGAISALSGMIPGFAHGGGFTVPGGGGTDSTPVSFMATPGEKVSISTPGQNGGGEGGGGSLVIHQNISTGVAQTVRAELMAMLPTIIERTKKGVLDAKLRGGQFAGAF